MQQQENSGLFHVAKWKLCILVCNSIFIVLFFEETPFSFFPVCLWLLLGWCYSHSLRTGRPNLHLRNTEKLVQLLGHSRLASDSMLEAQTLHKLPVKANLPNYILLKATIVLIHDWRAQTSVEMQKKKKKVQAALNSFQTFPPPSVHFNSIVRIAMDMVAIILSNTTKPPQFIPAPFFSNHSKFSVSKKRILSL